MTEPTPVKREITAAERWLLLAALAVGVLFDQLVSSLYRGSFLEWWSVFWLCYLVLFYALYWQRLARDKILWFIAACAAALCLWAFFFDGSQTGYGSLTMLVIPCVLMAHAAASAGEYRLKDAGGIAAEWFSGWFVKPFTGLPAFAGAAGSLVSGGRRPVVRKILLGAAVTLPLLGLLILLLSGADQVFGYYLDRITADWKIGAAVRHGVVVCIATALFYSFLWNIGFGKRKSPVKAAAGEIDRVVCFVVLGSVTLLYLLFCGIQFTYLFAGAGLPGGMTYAEYARAGFAQTVAVCAINLGIFGVFLRFGAKSAALPALLAGLLGLTGVMLVSGFVRLKLYIDAFGLTWLRLLSAWFILYLAAVLLLCAIRLVREKLPLIAVCALLLFGWYAALGYANPGGFAARYNESRGYAQTIVEMG
ncbi:MAG: DUF4173 domain-containing protein [Oscillospiraceae bacterium]|nr:DUF4173 domain-containing protein [Oscillospiraceae bacterium]